MKKLVPFAKEIPFKDNLSEIISISLEHDIQKLNDGFKGNFIVSGDYKLNMNSTHIDHFHFDLPFEIDLNDKYDISSASVDIDDFYYEVINNQILSVHIDVLIDHLDEKEEVLEELVLDREELPEEENEEILENTIDKEETLEKENSSQEESIEDIVRDVVNEQKEEDIEVEANNELPQMENNSGNISTMFDDLIDDNEYKSYKIYIVKDGDNLEEIIKKYSISIEDIKKYNDLGDLKKGDKIIIPYVKSK